MGFQQSVQRESELAKSLLKRYRRTVWGQPGYHEKVKRWLSIDQEYELARRREALICTEHSLTWVRGKP